ncbi:hypothetical protein KX75_20105 [Salmonella enterica subsp. enterica]|nr:hypothetical protein [Salmonella enterica subsp. enterica serovar Mikawasima]EDN7229178.1 hypothetical protein [Salmonella enterica subsp. enterica serovar Mikawasima]
MKINNAVTGNSATMENTAVAGSITGQISFQHALSATQPPTVSSGDSNTDWVASDPDAPVSGDGWIWTAVSPGVEEGTMPDGRACGYVNMDLVLTPEDKALVGWPCDDDPQMEAVAGMIAEDRACGDLSGPVTLDYILGNPDKSMEGLADRIPGTTDATIEVLVANLAHQDVQHYQDSQDQSN